MLLLYAAFSAFALWASHRFVRPLTRGAALTLALLPFAFTGPAALTGRVYAPLDLHYESVPLDRMRKEVGLTDERSRTRYDLAFEMIPWRHAARSAIADGEWPLWNPYVFVGDVLAASAQPAVHHPIHVAAYLVGLGPSLTFVATAVFFAAGLTMFLYCREIGCREVAALIGAAGWAFNGMVVYWMGWPLAMNLAFFPLLLAGARRIAREPGPTSAGLLSAAFVLVLLAGHPETAFHAVAVAALYGLAELLAAGRGPGHLPKSVGLAVLAGVVALALVAIDLLPMLEATPQTYLHARRGALEVSASVDMATGLERLRLAAFPFAYGLPWDEPRNDAGFGAYWYAHAGSVLFAPAVLALWRSRWRGRWWWLGAGIGGLLAFCSFPGLIDLLDQLPLFELTINRRMVFLTGFAWAVLAALGMETWAGADDRRRLGWLSLAITGVLALILAALWQGFLADGLSARFLKRWSAVELLPALSASALFLATRKVRLGMIGLLAILVSQRVMQAGELNPTHPAELLAPTAAELTQLPAEEEPYRIAGIGNFLTPNLAALYGLEDVRGSTPMANARLVETLTLWARPHPRREYIPRIHDLERPFLNFLNVRFAFVEHRPMPKPRPGKNRRRRARNPRAGKTYEGFEVRHSEPDFTLYENTRVLPRAFVPRHVRLVSPERPVLVEMAIHDDFSERAWIEVDEPEGNRADVPNGPGTVRTRRRGTALDLAVDMEEPGWVVVSQTAWKGWQAREGGRELPVRVANHAFLAFHVPEGRHDVELFYRPWSFVVGRAVTFSTAGLLILLGVLAIRRKHR